MMRPSYRQGSDKPPNLVLYSVTNFGKLRSPAREQAGKPGIMIAGTPVAQAYVRRRAAERLPTRDRQTIQREDDVFESARVWRGLCEGR